MSNEKIYTDEDMEANRKCNLIDQFAKLLMIKDDFKKGSMKELDRQIALTKILLDLYKIDYSELENVFNENNE